MPIAVSSLSMSNGWRGSSGRANRKVVLMRSPTLLTGVTGAVAVLVFVYVGLTAMSLQPHITFGNPNLRVASADKASASPGPATTAAPPAIMAAPSAPVLAPAAAEGPAGQ